ncbi:4-alpha-glucanotransferase [Litoreibacter ponti]|uniref:4-alpha-glucanotransferase n=1 Tax=Litoreibacter ponti TaxID=1510457 RepID=A0A2T6BFW5_9RHOB|nr:4-alpha-glucanotransferase [Litoreibacter ponti]PTX54958.1 4-alpha-glucanotransferase [Litoreibacter ponti]
MAEDIVARAAHYGILPRYIDQMEQVRETSPETAAALLAAMGIDPEDGLPSKRTLPRYLVVETSTKPNLAMPDGAWELTFEDGAQLEGQDALPALPLGIHRLDIGRERCWLLSAPASLPLPEPCWGMIVPLAGLRTAEQGGVGDYRDLGQLGQDLGGLGASYLGVNPVHAGFPTAPEGFSPYTPSHRRRLSSLYLPTTGHTPGGDLIDFRTEIPRHMTALRAEFDTRENWPGFEAYLTREGEGLTRFATHQALSDRNGPYWCDWPEELQDPGSDAVARAQDDLQSEILFHAWLQWRAEEELRAAHAQAKAGGMEMGLYLDLAVGTHPFGAETWEDRESFAFGASLGAPADAFSKEGQNWGLAPLDPNALIESGFRPLAETLRRQLSFAGVLRIDHILGFERAFWVPEGAPGGYVQMPTDAMLAVARIEAARAGAVIVGEDLGNIPDGLQQDLARSGILGCRVAVFEKDMGPPITFRGPKAYDAATIASFSTHDLPTWAGWREGAEIDARRDIGDIDAMQAEDMQRERTLEVAAFDALAGTSGDSPDAMHAFLAKAPARLVALQIENILDIEAQPNLPGTVDAYPNWRQRLPVGHDALAQDERVQRAAQIMAKAGR